LVQVWVNVNVKECGQQSDSPAIGRRENRRLKKRIAPMGAAPSGSEKMLDRTHRWVRSSQKFREPDSGPLSDL